MRHALRVIGWIVFLQAILFSTLAIAVAAGTSSGYGPVGILRGALVGLLPLSAALIATRNPHLAALVDLSIAPLTLLFMGNFSWVLGSMLSSIAVFSGAVFIPGLFWLLAARRGWAPILQGSFSTNLSRFAVGFGTMMTGLVLACFISLSLPFWDSIGDCGGRPLFDETGKPRHIDFTAKIFFVGPVIFQNYSLWSIARIDETFSQVPWNSRIVILRGFFKPADKAELYFVEGVRAYPILHHYLPVVEQADCGRTRPLELAGVQLRMLHDGLPKTGVRIIGRVQVEASRRAIPEARVMIEGPAGTTMAITDAQGIYDVSGLPEGKYTLTLASDPARGISPKSGQAVQVFDLASGQISEHGFSLD